MRPQKGPELLPAAQRAETGCPEPGLARGPDTHRRSLNPSPPGNADVGVPTSRECAEVSDPASVNAGVLDAVASLQESVVFFILVFSFSSF